MCFFKMLFTSNHIAFFRKQSILFWLNKKKIFRWQEIIGVNILVQPMKSLNLLSHPPLCH